MREREAGRLFVRVVERCLATETASATRGEALEVALAAAVADLTAYRKGRIAEWSGPVSP